MSMHCPSTDRWEAMLSGKLPEADEQQLDAHLHSCEECRQSLEHLTSLDCISQGGKFLRQWATRASLPELLHHQIMQKVMVEGEQNHPEVVLPEIFGYHVEYVLGQGGSSIVYAARDARLQRLVAIKLLREKATPVQRKRFQREAQLLASLQHANVARIFDIGETNEQPFLVLEYISGGSLAQYLQGIPQPAEQSARLAYQLACAIQNAHEAGCIHRDLKPGNILLEPHFGFAETTGLDSFLPKIIDFGIARDVERVEQLTNTRDFLGTPSYMAPEQITQSGNLPADHRMDVYSLGIILYETLTGRPPFRAVSPIDTMLQIKHDEPVQLTRLVPNIPKDLQNICLKCIEKDPIRRYSTAQSLADDLDRFLSGKPVLARPVSLWSRAWRWGKRYPGWAIAAALLLLVLLAASIIGPLLAHRERQLREETAFQASRARAHLDTTGQVLEEMLNRLLSNLRLQDPANEALHEGMVDFAIPYLETFVQQDEASDTLKLRQACSLLQLAMVQSRTKKIEDAALTYERAGKLLKDLKPSETLPEVKYKKALSSYHLEYGRYLQIHANNDFEAEEHYRTSVKLIDELARRDESGKYDDNYAIHYALLAALLADQPQRRSEQHDCLMKAVEYRERLLERFPHRDDLRHYAAMMHMNASIFYRQVKNHSRQLEELHRALELETQVQRSKSLWIDAPYYVSVLQGELGMSLITDKRHAEGLKFVRQGKEIVDALVVAYPSNARYVAQMENLQKVLKYFDSTGQKDKK